jgi:cytochrome c oxidase assembly protein subunit 16
MAVFPSKKYRPSSAAESIPQKYRTALAKHPFALFGLPFIATMVLGSFFLTPATALRYERHDRKVRQVTKEEELGIGKDKRKIDLREEYYVSCISIKPTLGLLRAGADIRTEIGSQGPGQLGTEASEAVTG